jgi:hypothetical protein
MKSQPRRNPPTDVSHGGRSSVLGENRIDAWIDELTPPSEVRIFPARHRRIGVIAFLVFAFVAVGIVGRWTEHGGLTGASPLSQPTPSEAGTARSAVPSSAPTGGFELISPTDGQDIRGAVVHVTGVASGNIRRLQFSVVLGDAVLGWTTHDVSEAGRQDVSIRVFAPPFRALAELHVEGGDAGPGRVSLSRSIALSPSGVVQLWSAESRMVGTACDLAVEGVAPLTVTALRLRILGRDRRPLADVTTANGIESLAAGSVGGKLVGMGGFYALIPMLAWSARDDLQLALSWVDRGEGRRLRSLEVAIGSVGACPDARDPTTQTKIVQTRPPSNASIGMQPTVVP